MFTRISEEDGNADHQFFDSNPNISRKQLKWVNKTTSMKAKQLQKVENHIFKDSEENYEYDDLDYSDDLYDEEDQYFELGN
jgi:hypothetical protein